MHVLAVEPYYGGSHRSFLDGIVERSGHEWTLVTSASRHWKWRMRSAPLTLAYELANQFIENANRGVSQPDIVFCSEMLDLPQWRGFLLSVAPRLNVECPGVARHLQRIATLPTVCYFHENQWTYPISPDAREDAHYGYTNLLTALSADEVWFNSSFHRKEFLDASRRFIGRMPDSRARHDVDQVDHISRVVAPGYLPVGNRCRHSSRPRLRIGWVARWEHDKRPDRFEELLVRLDQAHVPFDLILLGTRPQQPPDTLQRIEQRWSDRIRFNGFAQDRTQYHRWLQEIDVVISTADHEFFGIAICEAISAGATAVVPDALSYPEIVPPELRYTSLDQAVQIIDSLNDGERASMMRDACQAKIAPYSIDQVAARVDTKLERIVLG